MTDRFLSLRFPRGGQIGRIAIWACGKALLSIGHLHIWTWKSISRISLACAQKTEGFWVKLELVYDAIPWGGVFADSSLVESSTAIDTQVQPRTVLTESDLLDLLGKKHLCIIGRTGDGKSTIAQYFAYQIGGAVRVYDLDAAPDEWVGLGVVGRGSVKTDERASLIAQSMQGDLSTLEDRLALRRERGDKALAGLEEVCIADEFPALVSAIGDGIPARWLIRHGNRGRKPKRFIIILAQNDSVKSLGIEGEGGCRDNLLYLRLGVKALDHGKRVLSASDYEWLKSQSRPAMLENELVQLPDVRSSLALMARLQSVRENGQAKTAETTAEQGLALISSLPEAPTDDPDRDVWQQYQASGVSRSDFIKRELIARCGNYQAGKEYLAQLESRFQSQNSVD